MDKLYKILEEIRPDIDFYTTKALTTDRYIDSFDIVTIMSCIEDEFGIEIPVESMVPENFESAETIMKMIEALK